MVYTSTVYPLRINKYDCLVRALVWNIVHGRYLTETTTAMVQVDIFGAKEKTQT